MRLVIKVNKKIDDNGELFSAYIYDLNLYGFGKTETAAKENLLLKIEQLVQELKELPTKKVEYVNNFGLPI